MGRYQLTKEDCAKGARGRRRLKEIKRAAARARWGNRPAPTADEQGQQQKQPKGPKQPTKAELMAEIAQLKAQNNALRLRLLSVKSRPRMIPKTPIYRLIAPTTSNYRLVAPNSNPRPTTLISRQLCSKNKNPTTQFVAALEEAEEEERKDVALLINTNNMASTASSTPTINVQILQASATRSSSSSSGIYARKKQNAMIKQKLTGASWRRGYMQFSAELGRQLMEENPCAGFAEVSKSVAIEWERLSDEQKRQYDDVAEERAQVQAVQRREEQPHDHEHPPSASSGSSSTAAEDIKEEVIDEN